MLKGRGFGYEYFCDNLPDRLSGVSSGARDGARYLAGHVGHSARGAGDGALQFRRAGGGEKSGAGLLRHGGRRDRGARVL